MPPQSSENGTRPRVLVCWSGYTSYVDSCLQALAQQAEVHAVFATSSDQAPYQVPAAPTYAIGDIDGQHASADLLAELVSWKPDVALFSSWHFGSYRTLARTLKGACVRILCMDNRYRGTPRQRLGVLTAPVYVRPLYDGVFVPGEPQVPFARRLGFRRSLIRTGMYACDPARFQRSAPVSGCHRFLFAGRLVPSKGLDDLLSAYASYRSSVSEPWPLLVAGTGPMAAKVESSPGVQALGFVQPAGLPTVMNQAACLVLPSHFEPWGVVVHEAAAAGLLILASDTVGAAIGGMVEAGANGYLFPSGDVASLADGLRRVHAKSDAEREIMSAHSEALAALLTPTTWADRVLSMIE